MSHFGPFKASSLKNLREQTPAKRYGAHLSQRGPPEPVHGKSRFCGLIRGHPHNGQIGATGIMQVMSRKAASEEGFWLTALSCAGEGMF